MQHSLLGISEEGMACKEGMACTAYEAIAVGHVPSL